MRTHNEEVASQRQPHWCSTAIEFRLDSDRQRENHRKVAEERTTSAPDPLQRKQTEDRK